MSRMLSDVYNKKIEYANEKYLTQFVFTFENEMYYVKWDKGKFSEPVKIEIV